MSAKTISVLVILATGFQIYYTGFEFGLLLFIPARIWFLLTFQGIKAHATGETVVESLGWVIQIIVLTFLKFQVAWLEYLVMVLGSTVTIALIWYNESFFISLDVPEEEIDKYIK